MSVVRRRNVLTVLALAGAGTVAIASTGRLSPQPVATISADSLPWDALQLPQHAGETVRPRVALYISPRCPHCERAALTFAREIMRTGVNGLIVSADGRSLTESYQARLGLPPIALDTTHAFGRAAGIRLVPSMISIDATGIAVTRLVAAPILVARYVRRSR